ncbi:MAG: AIR synthase-related protein [Sulfolobales archaeon]|nr:AIR synthase-related protein [Sulfolobales archaeon]
MEKLTYSKAGVDLGRHRKMHSIALKTAEALSRKLGADISGLGGFTPGIKVFGKKLVLHVDGVGTKTVVLRELGAMKVAGWDCVAMNANDVACGGARLVAIADYIAMGVADEEIFSEVVEGVAEAAEAVSTPIVSGETAILPGLLSGVDVVCFTAAIAEREFSNRAKAGDVAVGVESWGLHANGYSLVRKVVEERIGGYSKVVDGVELGVELAKPTAIYYNLLLKAIELGYVTSATHITGGGWTKMKRVLGSELDAVLEAPKPSKIFEILTSHGDIDLDEAYRVFNMGIGLILTSPPDRMRELLDLTVEMGFKPVVLGRIEDGSGSIKIKLSWRGDSYIEI